MDNLKTSLRNCILEFLTPLDIFQFAKTSSVNFKFLKSRIDLELIKFYKQFQIIKADKLEKHWCIIILSAQKLFNTTKFEKTTLFYLHYLAIKYKILFERKKIFPKLLPYFESIEILKETIEDPKNKLGEIQIDDNMSTEEICQKIEELTKIEGLTTCSIELISFDKVTKEVWDLIKNQPFKFYLTLDEQHKIWIDKKKIDFFVMDTNILKEISIIQTSDILDRFDQIETTLIFSSYNEHSSEINDFLNNTKTTVLSFYFSNKLNKMDISNSEIRVINLDIPSAKRFDKIIDNNKGLIVYLDCQRNKGMINNSIRFRTENQINCLESNNKIVIHSVCYKNQKYLLNIQIQLDN